MSEKPLVSFDYAIKYLLRDKGNYGIIEGFISALLKSCGYSDVRIVALLDAESNKEEKMAKRSLADLVVEDSKKKKYVVEIERNDKNTFFHKACFNTSRTIVDSIGQGVDYHEIVKIFHISLLYFPVGNGPLYHGKTAVTDITSKEKLILHIKDPFTEEMFDATEIFPEYLFISIPLFNGRLDRDVDEWLYVMKHSEIPPHSRSPYMKQAAEKLTLLKMEPEERTLYYAYQKKLCDEREELKKAEEKGLEKGEAIGLEKGEAIGLEKGEAIGLEKGEAIGLEKGLEKGKTEERVALVTRMLKKGFSSQEVARIMEVAVEEIDQIVGLQAIHDNDEESGVPQN